MTSVKTSKYVYRSSGTSSGGELSMEYGTDIGALTRLEDKIRLLQEDLETEREIRQRIEREKSDLSIQVIQLSERLEEAEGSTESQFELNKRRDTELAKLRKLLEDVHLESEENAHMLRKKHQEIIAEFQDQLDQSQKQKVKIEKEKQRFQAEVYELLAQIENANKEKLISLKQVEKLEYTVHELNIKIEELNRTVVDITTIKTRLSQENIELIKEVQEVRQHLDSANHLKSQLATQCEDIRRRLEDEERRRSSLEVQVHTLEVDLESVRVQLEEESEARLDLERQLSKANADAAMYKSKYEAECQAHADELEEVRRKFAARTAEYEETIESLMNKASALEKQKSRLQSEVEVLIIDLEKANNTALSLQKRVEQLEKINIEIKTKYDELNVLYENVQRDLRIKITEIQKIQHEYEKLREHKDALLRENKKLTDDLHDVKNALSDATRRYHELEIEVKRLESEREELSAAYREAEASRKAEEAKAQRLVGEITQLRYDYEKRLTEKEEQIESIRKQYQIEIEQLNSRLVEAESKLKTEITRIKKKFQIQITELEMSLDVANKNNIELQKTIKRQALQITDLQNHYDEVQRQLQSTIDQYGVAQRRAQALQAELDEFRGTLEAALRAKRAAEQQYEEAHTRVNELTTINVNISAAKSKLEGELSAIQADFDELHKELKIADERANKAQSELKHTVEILHEEQERVVKIETIRKTLEVEVRTLQTRMEEVEANALVGGKRVISKLEARIRDIEVEFEEEKRRHAETTKVLRKKERHVKELYIQSEESQKTVTLLTDQVEKLNEKIKMYKRQLNEQEGMSNQNLQRVRRFQRELEAAEDRAEHAESNLSFIRAKHRSWVTSSQVPGATKQVYVVEEHRHEGF
uniref:Paramyosin n=1 Tax=Scolopendra viridis TaxID=118503 RepID=A0A4D5RAD0_SCOVI